MRFRLINRISHCIRVFGETNSELCDRFITRIYGIFYSYKTNQNKHHQQHYPSHFYFIWILILIFLIFFLINPIENFFSTSNYSEVVENVSIHKSSSLFPYENLILNIHNQSIHHIYIDIGCFNAETIEHFIHFNSDSSMYDIITFEPDPANYRICKQRLKQKKYRNYNIIIIPKVVWIRNEKVFYQVDRGERSRIDLNHTQKYRLEQLDAIDFSSWLSQLIQTNHHTKLRIKLSTFGIEVKLLLKMISDGTLGLANQWDIEWTNRYNHRTRPARIYVQSMFESLGYDCKYLTRLHDERIVFRMNGTYNNVTKYRDWRTVAQIDAYSHYFQRPDIPNPPRRKRTIRK